MKIRQLKQWGLLLVMCSSVRWVGHQLIFLFSLFYLFVGLRSLVLPFSSDIYIIHHQVDGDGDSCLFINLYLHIVVCPHLLIVGKKLSKL